MTALRRAERRFEQLFAHSPEALVRDRSFVDGLLIDADDAAIVRATISLARTLGLT